MFFLLRFNLAPDWLGQNKCKNLFQKCLHFSDSNKLIYDNLLGIIIIFFPHRCCSTCIMSHIGHHGNTDTSCPGTFKERNCFALCQSCCECR